MTEATNPTDEVRDDLAGDTEAVEATDDIASEANTGSAIRLGSSVWPSRSLRNGRPNSNRRVAVESLDTRSKSMPNRRRR